MGVQTDYDCEPEGSVHPGDYSSFMEYKLYRGDYFIRAQDGGIPTPAGGDEGDGWQTPFSLF